MTALRSLAMTLGALLFEDGIGRQSRSGALCSSDGGKNYCQKSKRNRRAAQDCTSREYGISYQVLRCAKKMTRRNRTIAACPSITHLLDSARLGSYFRRWTTPATVHPAPLQLSTAPAARPQGLTPCGGSLPGSRPLAAVRHCLPSFPAVPAQ